MVRIRQRNNTELKRLIPNAATGNDDDVEDCEQEHSGAKSLGSNASLCIQASRRRWKSICSICLATIVTICIAVAATTDIYSISTDSVLGTPSFKPAVSLESGSEVTVAPVTSGYLSDHAHKCMNVSCPPSSNQSTNFRPDLKAEVEPIQEGTGLLSVPFYIYEDWDWLQRGTYQGRTMLDIINDPTSLQDLGTVLQFKVSTDIWFLLAAYQHPQRTKDPAKARLFIVPTLINFYSRWGIDPTQFCVDDHCGGRLIKHTMEQIRSSVWFQKSNGSDHVMVNSYNYYWKRLPWIFHLPGFNVFSQLQLVGYEGRKDNHRNRYNLPDYKIGSRCQPVANKVHDFAMIASLHPERRKFQDRRNLCAWMGDTNSSTKYDMSICGSGKQCPALAEARFSFQVVGDRAGSQRLIDIILSETVPIFTRQVQYAAQPDFIDWEKISYFADISTKQRFLHDIDTIIMDKDVYEQKHNNVVENRKLFDWETSVPFDMYMYILQSKLWPESTKKRSPTSYSALKF